MAFTFDDQPYQRTAGRITVRGFSELNDKLRKLSDERVRRRLGDEAVLAGAQELVDPIKAVTPRRRGLMRRSVMAFIHRDPENRNFSVALAGTTWPGGAQAPVIEFGSKPRYTQNPRKYVGRVRKHPFVGPTGRRLEPRVRSVMQSTLAAGLERELQ